MFIIPTIYEFAAAQDYREGELAGLDGLMPDTAQSENWWRGYEAGIEARASLSHDYASLLQDLRLEREEFLR